jgi:hypothetical protein
MAQQPQQQNQQQLSLFGTSQQPQQQNQQQSNLFGQNQQPAPYNAAQLAAGVAPASQEIVAISRAFDKQSSEYRFRHLFLNVIDDPRRYPCPKGTSLRRYILHVLLVCCATVLSASVAVIKVAGIFDKHAFCA